MKVSEEFHVNTLKKELIERNSILALGDYNYFAKSLKWTQEELYEFYHQIYPGFLELCKPYSQAIYLLERLKKQGCKIHILSAREERESGQVYDLTKKWLVNYSLHFDALCVDVKDKSTYVKKNNIDLFIDDLWENCKRVAVNSNCLVCHMKCKYNSGPKYDYTSNMIPIYNLNEVDTFLFPNNKF